MENQPTEESPAIITGAAVNYEDKTGPTEFTPKQGATLEAHYYIVRVDLMPYLTAAGADFSSTSTDVIHIKQEGNTSGIR